MVFSAPIFLFGFLPLSLLVYYLSPNFLKNPILLLISLIFYAWGEVFYLAIMIVSICSNYLFGFLIYNSDRKKQPDYKNASKFYLAIAIAVNLALLATFKYANFIADNVNVVFSTFGIPNFNLVPIHLPLGISFFTFQAISYIVDIYRKDAPLQRDFFNFALYISLFPQLIAGPIVRYKDIAAQILERQSSLELFANGVRRFIFGLAKKVLIANSLGQVADTIFSMSGNDLTAPLAWIGILTYTLQLYFDFSGYSDMAIGLGLMFGFRFLENFNYPYISTSIREFWQRWHISLSTWFRDYVYISLGGNRVSKVRVYINLLIVFVITGFWHGASWNFLVWGLFHGLFLAAEHAGFSTVLQKVWKPIQHFYVFMIVIIGWVFFRAETLPLAITYLRAMFDIGNLPTTFIQFAQVFTHESIFAFACGSILALPIYPFIANRAGKFLNHNSGNLMSRISILNPLLLSALFFLSLLKVATSTYNPFIYFRF